MTGALLLLFFLTLGAHLAAALLWRQNQQLHEKLLRVTAKSATPAAVVQEIAPSPRQKTEQQEALDKERERARKELWRV